MTRAHLPRLLGSLAALVWVALPAPAASVPGPAEHLKLDIGADRVLADYRQIKSYFEELDRRSSRLELVNLGRTTLGRR